MNYSLEQTAELVASYKANPTRETVEVLAKKYAKPVKSIIGKLSKEGVYRREIYTTKRGETPITKLEIVSRIANALGEEDFPGLEKTPKGTLQRLSAIIEEICG
jgi:hypothetical protein